MTTSISALPALPPSADTRSMTERANAVIRNLYNKILPVGAANTLLTSDGTTFSWVAPAASAITNTGATTYMGADVTLNNAATFFSGPNTGSIGANGQTWLITAKACLTDSAGATTFTAQIHDGTNAVDSASHTLAGAGFLTTIALGRVVVLTAATTFTLQAKDSLTTGTLLRSNAGASTANLATQISAVRLA